MIFELELDNAPVPTEMREESLYLKKSGVFGSGPPFSKTQRLVQCFKAEWDYALVRDMDTGKVTAVNPDDLEGYVLVTETLADVVGEHVLIEKDKRLLAFQRVEHMMDELGAVEG